MSKREWLIKRIAELRVEIAKRIPGGWSTKSWERELDLRISQLREINKPAELLK